jgi:hypothetical protein
MVCVLGYALYGCVNATLCGQKKYEISHEDHEEPTEMLKT